MCIRDRFRACSREDERTGQKSGTSNRASGGRTKTARGINQKTKLSEAATENRAALLNLFVSLMYQAVFVLPPDESLEQVRNRSRMLTCVSPVML